MKIFKIIALIFFLSSPAIAAPKDDFENKTAGVKFSKPADWYFVDLKKYTKKSKETQKSGTSMENINKTINYEIMGSQLVVVSKYPEMFNADQENAYFNIGLQSNEMLKNNSAKATLEASIEEMRATLNMMRDIKIEDVEGFLPQNMAPEDRKKMKAEFQKVLKDFDPNKQKVEVEQDPIEIKVGGLNAAYMRLKVSATLPDGTTISTISQMWLVPSTDFSYLISSATPVNDKDSFAQVKKMVDSVVITKTSSPKAKLAQ